jgi:hypothetical protein
MQDQQICLQTATKSYMTDFVKISGTKILDPTSADAKLWNEKSSGARIWDEEASDTQILDRKTLRQNFWITKLRTKKFK